MRKTVRRLIVSTVLATTFFIGTIGTADAGELCARADLLRPLDRVSLCIPTS